MSRQHQLRHAACASPKHSAAELARFTRVGVIQTRRVQNVQRSSGNEDFFILHSFLAHLHRKQLLFLKDFTHLCIPLKAAMTTRHTYEELAERCVPSGLAQPSKWIAEYDTSFLLFPPIPHLDLSTSHTCNLDCMLWTSSDIALRDLYKTN